MGCYHMHRHRRQSHPYYTKVYYKVQYHSKARQVYYKEVYFIETYLCNFQNTISPSREMSLLYGGIFHRNISLIFKLQSHPQGRRGKRE